jgi:hypothetical protein
MPRQLVGENILHCQTRSSENIDQLRSISGLFLVWGPSYASVALMLLCLFSTCMQTAYALLASFQHSGYRKYVYIFITGREEPAASLFWTWTLRQPHVCSWERIIPSSPLIDTRYTNLLYYSIAIRMGPKFQITVVRTKPEISWDLRLGRKLPTFTIQIVPEGEKFYALVNVEQLFQPWTTCKGLKSCMFLNILNFME